MAQANPLRTIEAILEYGVKSSTYKFALIRALTDWVIEHPTARGDQHVPASWLAVRFIDYYWPLLTGARPVRQNTGRGNATLEEFFHEFQRRAPHDARLARVKVRPQPPRVLGPRQGPAPRRRRWRPRRVAACCPGAPEDPGAAHPVPPPPQERPRRTARPARTRRGGLRGRTAPSNGPPPRRLVRNATRLSELLADDLTTIVIPGHLHEGLVPLRYCIRSAVLGKWATYCEVMPQNHGQSILPRLEPPVLERDSAEVGRYRRLYQDLDLRSCWLTGEPLRVR